MGAVGDVALTLPTLWLPLAVPRQLFRWTGFSSRHIRIDMSFNARPLDAPHEKHETGL